MLQSDTSGPRTRYGGTIKLRDTTPSWEFAWKCRRIFKTAGPRSRSKFETAGSKYQWHSTQSSNPNAAPRAETTVMGPTTKGTWQEWPNFKIEKRDDGIPTYGKASNGPLSFTTSIYCVLEREFYLPPPHIPYIRSICLTENCKFASA